MRIVSINPGNDALNLLVRWIAEAFLNELPEERQ
jgi:hypothetical protein